MPRRCSPPLSHRPKRSGSEPGRSFRGRWTGIFFLPSVPPCGIILSVLCRCVGIGRRGGLKILCWRQRVGSSPTTGTKKMVHLHGGPFFWSVIEGTRRAKPTLQRTRRHTLGFKSFTVSPPVPDGRFQTAEAGFLSENKHPAISLVVCIIHWHQVRHVIQYKIACLSFLPKLLQKLSLFFDIRSAFRR